MNLNIGRLSKNSSLPCLTIIFDISVHGFEYFNSCQKYKGFSQSSLFDIRGIHLKRTIKTSDMHRPTDDCPLESNALSISDSHKIKEASKMQDAREVGV